MNSLERFDATVEYQPRDRIFYWGFPIRESTCNRWYAEGFPRGVDPHDYFGFDRWDSLPVHDHCWPQFVPTVLEETDVYKVWIDELGATRRDFKVIDTPGFVTRTWLRFPFRDQADFLAMQKRFDPDEPARFHHNWPIVKGRLPERDVPTTWTIHGYFWMIRDWMGFDDTCLAFHDHPELIRQMVDFLTDYYCRLLKNVLDDPRVELDLLIVSEDMAYKHAPMIGPQMTRDFFLDGYRRINDTARQYGTRHIVVDCDGYCNPLIPVWLEAGFEGITPMECASNVEVIELRKQYGRKLLMFGNIDKRELTKGPAAIGRQVAPKLPLAREGGFFIGVDHAVPPDVSFENYTYYVETLRRLGGRTAT